MSDDKKSFFDEINDLNGLLDSSGPAPDVSDEELQDILGLIGEGTAELPKVETVDEIVKEYQSAHPVGSDPSSETTAVGDLSSLLHSDTDTLPGAETHVIPDDVRKIYESKPLPEIKEENEVEEPVPEEEYVARNYRAIHRDRRHRTGCLGGLLYFLFIVCLSAALAAQ